MNEQRINFIERKNVNSIKWDYAEEYFGVKNILPFFIADMDLNSPSFLTEAFNKRNETPNYGYTFPSPKRKQALKLWYEMKGYGIEPEWITIFPFGAKVALAFILNALRSNRKSVLVYPPVFSSFYKIPQSNAFNIIKVPLILDGNKYFLDYQLQASLVKEAGLILFCNPHNPIGKVWTEEEIFSILSLLNRDTIFISDEVHSDLVYKGKKHIPAFSFYSKGFHNVVSLHSIHKTFNLAGIGNSFCIIPDDYLRNEIVNFIAKYNFHEGNIFSNIAFEKVISKNGLLWKEELMLLLEEQKVFTINLIKDNLPSIEIVEPEAGFVMWLDFRGTRKTHAELKYKINVEAKVGIEDGIKYGKEGEGFFRLNFACDRSILCEAINRLKSVL